jgi:hypothetical protein
LRAVIAKIPPMTVAGLYSSAVHYVKTLETMGGKNPWEYYKLVATIPAEQAARPLSESECPLVRK